MHKEIKEELSRNKSPEEIVRNLTEVQDFTDEEARRIRLRASE